MPVSFVKPADHDESAPALELKNVSVHYDALPALEAISLRVERGDQVAVVGPNGAGKSTLFNVIAGIVPPDGGLVNVYGSGPSSHICVGYVPQRNRLDWRFPATVNDVVMMGRVGRMGLFRWPSRRDRELVAAALEQVRMSQHAQKQIGELSGGQQQRAFLARALAQEAELLLLDEPLTGLDIPSQDAIAGILMDLRDQGITTMIATHDLSQAAERFPKMMMLNRRLVAYGPPSAVLTAETLAAAYGNQIHVIHGANGDLFMTDTCCSGGHPPVHSLLGAAPAKRGMLPTEPGSLTEPENAS